MNSKFNLRFYGQVSQNLLTYGLLILTAYLQSTYKEL